jgi:DNA-binding XRE family transcriptional regulator
LAMVSGVDQSNISALETNRKVGARIETMVAIARAFRVPTDDLFVTAEPVPEEPMDPQIDVFMHLVEDMLPEERASAEMFVRFVIDQRKKDERRKKRRKKADAT